MTRTGGWLAASARMVNQSSAPVMSNVHGESANVR
jgi:hypothetical protein